jgi:hypothetical protein
MSELWIEYVGEDPWEGEFDKEETIENTYFEYIPEEYEDNDYYEPEYEPFEITINELL